MQQIYKNMNRIYLLIGLLVLSSGILAQQNAAYLEYIEKYRDMAIEQQIKHRIPAAITMAQGILESNAGRSELAVNANNHFGIKCASDWVGLTFSADDDTKSLKFSMACKRRFASGVSEVSGGASK